MKMQQRRVRSPWQILTTAAAAALLTCTLAACSDDEDTGAQAGDGTPTEVAVEDARLEFAQCMREHGVDMEDPEPGGGIMIQGGPGDEKVMEAAQEACQQYLDEFDVEGTPREIPAEQKEALLSAAQCMRDRGWNVPDPEINGGRVIQKLDEDADFDPNDPGFQKDQEECAAESGVEAPGQRSN